MVGRFVQAGIEHIFLGYDHIAFLAAIVLWAQHLWPVIKIVTAFTIAEPGLNVNGAAPHIRRCRIWTDGGDLPIALTRRGAQQLHDLNRGAAAFGFKGLPHFFQQPVGP